MIPLRKCVVSGKLITTFNSLRKVKAKRRTFRYHQCVFILCPSLIGTTLFHTLSLTSCRGKVFENHFLQILWTVFEEEMNKVSFKTTCLAWWFPEQPNKCSYAKDVQSVCMFATLCHVFVALSLLFFPSSNPVFPHLCSKPSLRGGSASSSNPLHESR